MMAAARVIGHEVEQHAHVALVRRLHQAEEPRIAPVARLHGEEVLVVVSVMRRTLMNRAQPEDAAAQAGDVVQVLADAVQRAAVQRGSVARSGQACARPRESVDQNVIADGIAQPLRRRRRRRLECELLAAGPGIGV
jgi:hypothetical protein